MTHYALFGHPVEHSLSPRIHAQFAEQTGVAMDYAVMDVMPENFAVALADFAQQGGVGANITLPHKIATLPLCQEISDRARRCGAVNTLTRTDNGWRGDNTDGEGLVRDLTGRGQRDLRERRTLMLGAGGAAAGIAPALIDAGIGDLYIVNRTPARADALADALGMPGHVHSRYWEDLGTLGNFDLIINATSAARSNESLQLPIKLAYRNTLAVDLGYGDAAIDFLAWARNIDCQEAIDGLGMLVEQAAESFAIWHGVRPQTEPVYTMLRDELLVKATD